MRSSERDEHRHRGRVTRAGQWRHGVCICNGISALMRYVVAAILGFVALSLANPASSFWQSRDSNYNLAIASVVYAGPCDVATGGCAAAYSVTRSMRSAYAGSLFQLSNGSSTLDVGQVGHVADLSGIPAFCAGKTCVYSKIYDQSGNGADLLPATTGTAAPSTCTTGNASGLNCASAYWLDGNTGLPIVQTTYPSEYDVAATAITGGANPVSVFFYGRNESWPGIFGIGHAPGAALTNGTDFIATVYASNVWATAPTNYITCSGATVACLAVDEETSVEPFDATNKPGAIGATYSTGSNGDINVLITYDGSSTVKGYANSGTALFTDSPPSSFQYDSSNLAPGNHVKLGCGGDCTNGEVIFREGFVTNSTLSSADYASIASNVSAFYSAHTTAPSCAGMGDIGYNMQTATFPTNYRSYSPFGSNFLSWSLALTKAGYYGPIADLYNGTTTQTFYSAQAAGATGCGIDPAAVTFCSPSCTVAKLYNQGSVSFAEFGNVHDDNLDLVFSSGQRPAVTFSGLNGLATMNFTGGQYGCTANAAINWAGYFAISAVARRTGSFTSYQNVLHFGVDGTTNETQLGYNNTANNIFEYYFSNLNVTAATDSHWHHLYVESQGSTKAPFVDGVAGTTFANSNNQIDSGHPFCIGAKSGGTQALTGDIAEIDVLNIQSFAASAGYVSQASNAFAKMQSLWGTLPN